MQPPASTQNLASRRQSPVSSAILGITLGFDRALQEVASWFVATPRSASQAAESARQLEMIGLLAIIALGALVRFWGLGVVGLHGDEKTMALPMMGVIEKGESVFPSGMPYVRAIFQVYLMAWSVELFGASEWAMRLPSAICGVVLIPLAFFAGRRFLSTPWSLAFAFVIALLPEFIIAAQTARMYVFFVTCVAALLLFLFKWERTDKIGYLIGALVAYGLGVQFHTLMVFSAPLFLYPGLVRGNRRMTLQGVVAFVIAGIGFVAMDRWIGMQYFDVVPLDGVAPDRNGPKAAAATPDIAPWLLIAAVAAAGAAAWFLLRPIPRKAMSWVAAGLVAAGTLAQILFFYHAAALLIIAGLVIARRHGPVPVGRLVLFCIGTAAIAVAQVLVIESSGVSSMRLIVGAMVGWPSIWPYIVGSEYSLLAGLLVGGALAVGLWRFAHRQAVPEFVLFVIIGVWLPLLLIGTQRWWIPPRYADGQSLPILLGAMAMGQWAFANFGKHAKWIAAAVCAVLVVNPVLVANAVNAGYTANPDHKGAAEFMRTVPLRPGDVIVAEDSLQQQYYLGHVDYWLNAKDIAQKFVYDKDGVARDFYTDAKLIGTGEELQALIDKPNRGTIYVIGSGENHEDGRRLMRAYGIAEVMASPLFKEIFTGRDGHTKVWKIAPPRPRANP
jgi:4-amino-4-deoxy-L-arabinose transferase-like glycosyltransferase